MKAALIKSIIMIILIMPFIQMNAQITKEQAIDSVMANIIQQDSVNYNVLLFPELIVESDFTLSSIHILNCPYDSAWLFFVDMIPIAHWEHDCKYLFISKLNGEITQIPYKLPPIKYQSTWEEINTPYPYPEEIIHTNSNNTMSSGITSDPHKYAVFICLDEEDADRWNNLSHIYCGIRRNFGFMDQNIFVLSGDGIYHPEKSYNLDNDLYNSNDFDGPCTKDLIISTFQYLSRIMDPTDILFVYATSHGGTDGNNVSNLWLWDYDYLYDWELANLTRPINCSQKIFAIDACFSGGFKNDLEGDHSVIQTCVDGETRSVVCNGCGFTEMTYWWGTAIRGYHPSSPEYPYNNGAEIGMHVNPTDFNPDMVEHEGNGDGFIQFQEVWNYAYSFASDLYLRGGQNSINDGFVGDLLTLNGIEGRVDVSQSIIGNYLFGRKLTLSSGVTLSKGNSSLGFYLNDSTEILIDDGAMLNISGYTTDITGSTGESFITVFGDLSSSVMHFTADADAIINVTFANPNKEYEFESFTFNNARVSGSCNLLSFTTSTFDNSTIEVSHPGSNDSYIEIYNNEFNNNSTVWSNAVITIEGYPNFEISNNVINYESGRGIELFNAGWDGRGEHWIYDNTIELNEISPYLWSDLGIHSYFSNAVIEKNRIKKNNYGIVGFHQSNLAVLGIPNAQNTSATQLIADNTRSQCLFNYQSRPYEFKWNVISYPADDESVFIKVVEYDELLQDTSGVPDWQGGADFIVEYNCWINEINMDDRLVPTGLYDWEPTWCPSGGHEILQNEPEIMYYEAIEAISDSNYTEGESGLKQVISEYPENNYALASLKGLFALNPALYDTNYSALKSYCVNLSGNPGDSLLGKSAEWISIHCKIKNKEYQQAINSLDSILANPGAYADSVFALIDLSEVFSEMSDSTGMKLALVTQNPQVIPGSYKQFVAQRKDWIDLLLKSDDENPKNIFPSANNNVYYSPGKITSIYPNPFKQQFSVEYELLDEGILDITVVTTTGRQVLNNNYGRKSVGNYQETLSLPTVQSGILLLVLKLDGAIIDTEKILCD